MTSHHRLLLRVSLVLFAIAIVLFVVSRPLAGGTLLAAFFLIAAIGVRGSERLRVVSYSLLIFGAMILAICFPTPVVAWGDIQLSKLILPLLQIIMFGMATVMSAKDFDGVVK